MQLRDYWMPPSLSPAGSLDVWVYRHKQVKGWWWWWWMRKKVLSGRCVNHKVKALDPVYGTAAEEAIWGAWGLKNKASGRVLSWHVWVSTSVFATGRFNKEGEEEGGGAFCGFLRDVSGVCSLSSTRGHEAASQSLHPPTHKHRSVPAHSHTHTTTGACLFLVFNWFSFLIQTQPKSGPVKRRILHSCAKARPYIQTGRFEASHKIRYPVVFVPNFCNRHMSDWHLGSNLMCIFSSVCATKNTVIAQFRSFFFSWTCEPLRRRNRATRMKTTNIN